jgi:glycosyltransferase involved in cell wall biosynthesis
MEKILPIDIVLVTYQRLNYLKETVEAINKRTLYPFNLIVVDNASTDGTQEWCQTQTKLGQISRYVRLDENKGLAIGLTEGLKFVKSEYFITTQDDIIPPDLRPCWLERILHLAKENPDYGGISMRIQRTRHQKIDESKDLIESPKSLAAVFRIQKKSDLDSMGGFGTRNHWESHSFKAICDQLKKKTAMATHLYADHFAFMDFNKGYDKNKTDYFTYSPERVDQGKEKPYPILDPKTNIPLKIVHPSDTNEQKLRTDRWKKEYGIQNRHEFKKKGPQRDILAEYCKVGKGIDIGCGRFKCHPNAIGIDAIPFPNVDMVIDASKLWMFKDGELDFIVGCHSLEHFRDTKETLKEWARCLKVGGVMALIVPDAEITPKTIAEESHKVALTKEVMRVLFRKVIKFKLKILRNLSELEGSKAQTCILCVGIKRA